MQASTGQEGQAGNSPVTDTSMLPPTRATLSTPLAEDAGGLIHLPLDAAEELQRRVHRARTVTLILLVLVGLGLFIYPAVDTGQAFFHAKVYNATSSSCECILASSYIDIIGGERRGV